MSKVQKFGKYNVRTPKGGLGPADRAAVSQLMSDGGLRSGAKCVIIVARKRTGVGRPVAFQRCEGANGRAKWAAAARKLLRSRKVCRIGSGPKKGLFKRCK